MDQHQVEYVSGRLFIDGVWGVLSCGYFNCRCPSCPFSLKVVVENVDDKNYASGVERVVFRHHYHDAETTKVDARREIQDVLASLGDTPTPEQAALLEKCEASRQDALALSEKERKRLLDLEAVRLYALKHPGMSAKKVVEECRVDVNPRVICNMRKQAKKQAGIPTNFVELI